MQLKIVEELSSGEFLVDASQSQHSHLTVKLDNPKGGSYFSQKLLGGDEHKIMELMEDELDTLMLEVDVRTQMRMMNFTKNYAIFYKKILDSLILLLPKMLKSVQFLRSGRGQLLI